MYLLQSCKYFLAVIINIHIAVSLKAFAISQFSQLQKIRELWVLNGRKIAFTKSSISLHRAYFARTNRACQMSQVEEDFKLCLGQILPSRNSWL